MVSIDGMKADYYLHADELGLKIPTLRQIMREGSYARGSQSVCPPVTYPNHTAMATGDTPLHHHIPANTQIDWNNTHPGEWFWYAQDIAARPIWDRVHDVGGRSATVSWPVTVGASADYEIPEYFRYGYPHDFKLLRAMVQPRTLLDDVMRSFGGEKVIDPDDVIERSAAYIFAKYRPELTMVHLVELDEVQHNEGPETPAALATLEAEDHRLGLLWQAARTVQPDATLVVVSDHGFTKVDTEGAPNFLLAEAGLDKVARAMTAGGYAGIYMAPGSTDADRVRVETFLQTLPQRADSGVAQVLSRADLDKLGAFPGASWALYARDRVYFTAGLKGPATRPGKNKGAHGYDPTRRDQQASFLAIGSGIKPGVIVEQAHTVDVGPTVARLLGIPMDGVDGRPLLELLAP